MRQHTRVGGIGQIRECNNMKYTAMRAELREKHPDFKANLTNVIVDVLGVYIKGLREQVTTLLVKKCYKKNVSERAAKYYLVA